MKVVALQRAHPCRHIRLRPSYTVAQSPRGRPPVARRRLLADPPDRRAPSHWDSTTTISGEPSGRHWVRPTTSTSHWMCPQASLGTCQNARGSAISLIAGIFESLAWKVKPQRGKVANECGGCGIYGNGLYGGFRIFVAKIPDIAF